LARLALESTSMADIVRFGKGKLFVEFLARSTSIFFSACYIKPGILRMLRNSRLCDDPSKGVC